MSAVGYPYQNHDVAAWSDLGVNSGFMRLPEIRGAMVQPDRMWTSIGALSEGLLVQFNVRSGSWGPQWCEESNRCLGVVRNVAVQRFPGRWDSILHQGADRKSKVLVEWIPSSGLEKRSPCRSQLGNHGWLTTYHIVDPELADHLWIVANI